MRVLGEHEENKMVATNRKNALALAVLICLSERPMHPYEVATTLRQRDKHESVRLNYGSLYAVVESLEKRGLITPQETAREGRRPERTVYEITEAGRIEMPRLADRAAEHPDQGVPALRGRTVVPARAPARGRRRAAARARPALEIELAQTRRRRVSSFEKAAAAAAVLGRGRVPR